jgi:hypothetical protein
VHLAVFACIALLHHGQPTPIEAVNMFPTTNKDSLARVLQNNGTQCGATELSLAKVENLPRMRTLLSVWTEDLAPLPELLVGIDATSCTLCLANTSSGLDVHVLNLVASIKRAPPGITNAAPHKSAHHCKVFSQKRTKHTCAQRIRFEQRSPLHRFLNDC